MARPIDAVVAGSREFAVALFAPLGERTGGRPRVAAGPDQALALCRGSAGILVVEWDPRWLAVVEALRREAPALRVVAALPRGLESAALSLAPLGAVAVPWDGAPAAVLGAIDRVLGPPGAAAAEAPAPAPAHRAPTAGAPTAPTAPLAADDLFAGLDLGGGSATPTPGGAGAAPPAVAPAASRPPPVAPPAPAARRGDPPARGRPSPRARTLALALLLALLAALQLWRLAVRPPVAPPGPAAGSSPHADRP